MHGCSHLSSLLADISVIWDRVQMLYVIYDMGLCRFTMRYLQWNIIFKLCHESLWVVINPNNLLDDHYLTVDTTMSTITVIASFIFLQPEWHNWLHHRYLQGSHRNVIINFHDFSMTIYTVFHDARKANTEDHNAYSTHTRTESNIFLNWKKESKRWFASFLSLRFGN